MGGASHRFSCAPASSRALIILPLKDLPARTRAHQPLPALGSFYASSFHLWSALRPSTSKKPTVSQTRVVAFFRVSVLCTCVSSPSK